jgi:hypothetical protein
VDATLTRDLIIAVATDLKKSAETEQRMRTAALERKNGRIGRSEATGRHGHEKNSRLKRGRN